MLKLVGKCKVFVNTFEKSVKIKGKTKKVDKTTYSCCIKSNDDEVLYANLYFADDSGFEDIESGDRIEVTDAFIIGNRAYEDNAYLSIYVNAFEFVTEEEDKKLKSSKRPAKKTKVEEEDEEEDEEDEEEERPRRKKTAPASKTKPAKKATANKVKTKNKIADLLAGGYTMEEINAMSDDEFIDAYGDLDE